MQVEQAIFTSCRTPRMDGYQLAATSRGVTREQADELSAWGPAHDSLAASDARGSINFHLLLDGTACISKTLAAGAEYSGRSGPRVYTTSLLVAPDLFDRFANQPLRILDAVAASGQLRVLSRLPESLPAISLRGRASATMPSLLAALADDGPRRQVLAVLAAASAAETVLIRGGETLRTLIDWTMNLLPVECRPWLTFSTGLKHSAQRRFRVALAPDDPLECNRIARQSGAVLLDLHERAAVVATACPWVATVDKLLTNGEYAQAAALLREIVPTFAVAPASRR